MNLSAIVDSSFYCQWTNPTVTKMLRVMKLTAFILLVACLQASATGSAQDRVTFSVKEMPVEKVFSIIEKQTNYSFLYTEQQLRDAKKVTISIKDMNVRDALLECLRGQPFDFKIEGKTIFIVNKNAVATLAPALTTPLIDIKGHVVNEKGGPAPGVTVAIKGTNIVTTTDANGDFTLHSVQHDATLIFTHVSLETFELKVSDKSDIVIVLKTKISELSGVEIINTGYQQISKDRLTGSFSQPNKKIYENRVSTDVLSKLEGITSSLAFNINRGPVNTGSKKLAIRGLSTIYSDDRPLIVLDNFPYEGDINNINPNDVESVTILKDAAAASIWGSLHSANGVIVITTKKAAYSQGLKVELNTNFTVGEKPDLKYNPNFISSSDFIDFEARLFQFGSYDADLSSASQPVVSPVVEILNRQRAGQISPAEATSQINALKENDVRNDIEKYFYRHSRRQQYSINMSSGNAKSNYLMSVGYDNNLNNQLGNGNNRVTLNSAISFRPLNNLEFSTNVLYAQQQVKTDNALSQLTTARGSLYPYAALAGADGSPLTIAKDYRQPFVDSAEINGFLNWQFSPLKDIGLNTATLKINNLRASTSVKYRFFTGLTGEIKYLYEKQTSSQENNADVNSYYTRNLINSYADVTNNAFNIPIGGIIDFANSTVESQNIRAQLGYSRNWNNHAVTLLAGIEARESKQSSNSNRLYGFDKETGAFQFVDYLSVYTLYPSGFPSSIPSSTNIERTLERYRSYFFTGDYTLLNKYIIYASGRIDQSNFFGVKTNQRAVPLWSVGGKWNLSKESFYKVSFLPELQLRASMGYNGNLNKSVTGYTTAIFSDQAFITALPYVQIQNPGNPDLRWEKTAILNFGIDFSSKNAILSGSLEYYIKKSKDLMANKLLAPSTGFIDPITATTSFRGNFANMRTEGVDFVLNSRNINKTFKWNSQLLVSYVRDKVTHFDIANLPGRLVAEADGTDIIPLEGKPVFGVYSFPFAGLNSSGDPQGYVGGQISTNYTTLTNPASVNDIKYHGPALPTYFGGFTNTFEYKRFSVSFTLSYKLGYFFRRRSIDYSALYTAWSGHKDYARRWQKPGDEATTTVPSFSTSNIGNVSRDGFYALSSTLVENASHIRFQDINVSYDINPNLIRRTKSITQLRLYLNVSNLGILWRANSAGLDPDIVTNGYPTPKSASLGIKCTL